tara:strand:+ start:4777 stop:4938 length:162 start_codon:yes stop_codon:yes gene_type:complete
MGWMKEVWRLTQEEGMTKDEAYDAVATKRKQNELETKELTMSQYERGSSHNQG